MIVTASRLKLINKSRVLWEINRSPGISRRELSRRLNSTDTNLSRITRDLIAEGFLLEQATARPSGRGRPNVGLFLNPSGLHVLCILLSRYERKASIVCLSGQRVAEEDLGDLEEHGHDHIIDSAARLVARLTERPELRFERLAGVSLIVSPDVELGDVKERETWLDDLLNALCGIFNVPATRTGIAEALHIAEARQTPELPALPSVMVHAGFALDASVIGSDEPSATIVFEGNLNDVPVGHDPVEDTWLRLDDIASAGAVLRRLGHVEQGGPSGQTGLSLGVPHAIRQANSGDPRAAAAFREAGTAAGVAIAALVTMLMPARVILAGPLASAAPFMDGFRAALRRTPAGSVGKTTVIRSTLSDLRAAEAAGLEWFAFSDMALDRGEALSSFAGVRLPAPDRAGRLARLS